MRIFDNGFSAGDGIDTPGFAAGLMRMAKAWESLSVHNGRVVWSNDGRPKIVFGAFSGGGGSVSGNLQPSINGSTVTVTGGSVIMHGIAEYPLANGSTVELTGSVEWVYVEIARGSEDGTALDLKHSSTKPDSNDSTLRIRLAKYENSGTGYVQTDWPHVGGNINLDAPTM